MTKITKIAIPHFESSELSPKVLKLLEIIQQQGEAIQQLRDEIAVLKGHKTRPVIKPSRMEEEMAKDSRGEGPEGKRPGSLKKSQ